MDAFLVSLAVVFVAELGDKSQLLTLSFATRLPPRTVVAAIAGATAVLMGLSVTAGNLVAGLVPERLALAVSSVLFVAFGLWTLRGEDEDEEGGDDAPTSTRASGPSFFTVFGAYSLAELGDKTMLATFTLAANAPALATWAGATAGMVGANLLAVGVGRVLGATVPRPALRVGSALLFLAVAAVLAVQAALAG